MTLSEASEQYICKKQARGCAFEGGAKILRGFGKYVGNVTVAAIDADDILSYLNKKVTSNITWRAKHATLSRFFNYWSHRGSLPNFIMPLAKPKVRQTFIPYIYTQSDIKLLLNSGERDQRPILTVAPLCTSAMLIFLYATGACVGETSRIVLSDLDLDSHSVTFRSTQKKRHRTIPLGADLVEHLRPYVVWRSGLGRPDSALFMNRSGVIVTAEKFGRIFCILRRTAALCRRDGTMHNPRVEDLRHTFAVHRIDKWIREGADLNRMLPALAAYMGQKGLGATHRYLLMTPERFRKDLDKLSPTRGPGMWHEDPSLMKFLSEL